MKLQGPESRGSAGSITWSRNTFALYTKARSGRGGLGDAVISSAMLGWQANGFQGEWNYFAASFEEPNSLGVRRSLTGVACYVRQSIFSQLFAAVPLDEPNGLERPKIENVVLLDEILTGLRVTWEGEDVTWVEIESTGWETTGTNRPPGRGRWWKTLFRVIAGVSGPYSGSQSLEAQMIAQFGARPGSGRAFARVRGISPISRLTGARLVSPWVQF